METPMRRHDAPGMQSRWAVPAVLIVLASALLSSACGHSDAPSAREARHQEVAVRTVAAAKTAAAGGVVPGLVQARQRAALSARIPASVVALPYREGETVSAGDVVVRLDDRALRSALTAAETAARTASTDLSRLEALVKRQAATPRERDEAAARAAAAQASVQAAKDQLTYAVLAAPFAGRVAARPAHVGDVVAPGATLIVIEGRGGFEVQAALDADQAPLMKVGDHVAVEVDGVRSPLGAVVRSVSAAADPTTHRFDVRADLPSTPGLRSGLFARLRVSAPTAAEESPAIAIPASALVERGGLTGVYVVSQGRARLRWIATGPSASGRVEVRAGLTAGERVVLHPEESLSDGAVVTETSDGAPEGGL